MGDICQPRNFTANNKLVDDILPSPNFGDRPDQITPSLVIVHYTGMRSAKKALKWLCSAKSQVSCHYYAFDDGRIVQCVGEDKRAWHAGLSCWRGEYDINSHSIGIEIANPGHEFGYVDFPIAQMNAVVNLIKNIVDRNQICVHNILAHSDIAPLRKQDPGERFDWQMLHKAGLGKWVEPAPIVDGPLLTFGGKGKQIEKYQTSLKKLGYEITINSKFDDLTYACTKAFQRHFRPEKVDGIGDASTLDTLERLNLVSK